MTVPVAKPRDTFGDAAIDLESEIAVGRFHTGYVEGIRAEFVSLWIWGEKLLYGCRKDGLEGSGAHLVKKRCAEISAQGYLGTVGQFHDAIAMKERVQSANGGFADNCRSMNADKMLRVKFVL
jgi:hypothetical protein